MRYNSESEKIYDRASLYLRGRVVDIGCGNHKITPEAIGVDANSLPGVDIVQGASKFEEKLYGTFDTVFSSHLLEHMQDDYGTLVEWTKLLKSGGALVLYLPDGRFHDNNMSRQHFRDYTYQQFMLFFRRAFCGEATNFKRELLPKLYDIVDSGMDIGEDRYSFFLVAIKCGLKRSLNMEHCCKLQMT